MAALKKAFQKIVYTQLVMYLKSKSERERKRHKKQWAELGELVLNPEEAEGEREE